MKGREGNEAFDRLMLTMDGEEEGCLGTRYSPHQKLRNAYKDIHSYTCSVFKSPFQENEEQIKQKNGQFDHRHFQNHTDPTREVL